MTFNTDSAGGLDTAERGLTFGYAKNCLTLVDGALPHAEVAVATMYRSGSMDSGVIELFRRIPGKPVHRPSGLSDDRADVAVSRGEVR